MLYKQLALQKAISFSSCLTTLASLFPVFTFEPTDPLTDKRYTSFTRLSTNETRHHDMLNALRPLQMPSLFLGTSCLQNFSMIAVLQPSMALIVDYNPFMVAKLQVVLTCIRESATPENFIALLRKNVALLVLLNQKDDRVYEHVMNIKPDTTDYISRKNGYVGLFKDMVLKEIQQLGTTELWLKHPEHYENIRAMVLAGRIQISCGDYTDVARFTQLKTELSLQGISNIAVYISNIEDHVRDIPDRLTAFHTVQSLLDPDIVLYSECFKSSNSQKNSQLQIRQKQHML